MVKGGDVRINTSISKKFLIKSLLDQREKSYLFSSLFFLIFYLEKSRSEKWRKVKSEKRIEKRTKRKSRLRDFSFWSWKWDLNPRPIDYESIALPLRHSSIRYYNRIIIPYITEFVKRFCKNPIYLYMNQPGDRGSFLIKAGYKT